MGVANTLATANFLFKENYTAEVQASQFKGDRTFLSRLKTRENVEGNPMKVPMITGPGGGVGMDLVSASASSKGISGPAFYVQPATLIGHVPLAHQTQLAAKNEGAFVDLKKREIDAKLDHMGILASAELYGDGGGSVGRGATLNTNTLTLTNKTDAINFWEGTQVESSVNDGTNVGHARKTGFMTVVSVDRDNGTVTFDSVGGISGFAATDYLYFRGVFAGNLSTTGVVKGLRAWFPLTAPSDTLWTVARTGRPDLAGFRLPTAEQTGGVVERIKRLSTHGFSTFQAKPLLCPLHPKQWEQASISLSNQGQRIIEVKSTATIAGYNKLNIISQAGTIDLIADAHCPLTQTWLIDEKSCYLEHLGPELIDIYRHPDTDSMFVTSANDMGEEVRIYSYFNFVSEAPWRSGTTSLPAI